VSKVPGVDSGEIRALLEPVLADLLGRLTGAVPELPELPSWAPGLWTGGLADRLVAGSVEVRREAALAVVGLMEGRPAGWWASPLGVAVCCGLVSGERVDVGVVSPSEAAAMVGCHTTYLHRLLAAGRLERGEAPVGVPRPAGRSGWVELWPLVLWVASRSGCGGCAP
jgi:hypothetical protein